MDGQPGKRLLLVEDDADTRETLAYALELAGFQVRTAGDGDRGLELAAQWEPDLMLLDLLMRRLHGEQLIEALQRDPSLRKIPVIVISGLPAGSAPAAFAHVQKPFALQELIRAVRAALGESGPGPADAARPAG